ncbi:hypothetical protein MML48_2g00016491 [Holotrichia oblita]|uniref:Uncharacterized protein n=1 Tax=Holotrichia oblita TaxID=644536 RepID=A0ACB9TMT4_HOLOL|nr:hypothetical protein MML48_2g00016491 [Holotrichia oblita]
MADKLSIFEGVSVDEAITKEQYHAYYPRTNNFNWNYEIRININNEDNYTLPAESFLYIEGEFSSGSEYCPSKDDPRRKYQRGGSPESSSPSYSSSFEDIPQQISIDTPSPPEIRNDCLDTEKHLETTYSITDSQLRESFPNNVGRKRKAKVQTNRIRRKHFSIYCDQEVGNFSRHLERKHGDELKVQEFMSVARNSTRRKKLIDRLRREGDFTTSKIIPVMKADNDSRNYIACKFCSGYYSAKSLRKHAKKCFFNPDPSKPFKAQIEGHTKMAGHFGPNDILRSSGLLSMLKADDISLVAKKDEIICEGARRYIKSHKEKHVLLVAKRYMRRLARLLIEIQKESHSNNDRLARLKRLLTLIDTDWAHEISSEAGQNLAINKFNKPTMIPLAKDVKKFEIYLKNLIRTARHNLVENSSDVQAFRKLVEAAFCTVLIFSKRRVGELQRMTLLAFMKNYNTLSSSEFEKALTDSEEILYKTLKRVVIRGKRGRGLPVLFDKYTVEPIEFFITIRKNFDLDNNPYFFGVPGTDNPITGNAVMRKHAKIALADVKKASLLTSTRLRKHLATITQIFKMDKTELEQLATFMGHTQKTHSEFYRLPDDVYQTAKISKLLLLSKENGIEKFKGKSLEEIELDDEIIEENVSNEDEEGAILDADFELPNTGPENVSSTSAGIRDIENLDNTSATNTEGAQKVKKEPNEL